jgi:hypothetical protein
MPLVGRWKPWKTHLAYEHSEDGVAVEGVSLEVVHLPTARRAAHDLVMPDRCGTQTDELSVTFSGLNLKNS